MTVITKDQIEAWLERVYADRHLTAHEFKLAFALARAADAEGFVGPAGIAKLAGADDTQGTATSFPDALEHLAAHGHLKGCGKRRKPGGFRIAIEAPVMAQPPTATVTPFPSARRGSFIRKQAERMKTLTPTHSDAHLRQQLKIQADTMRRRGVTEDVIAREIRALESGIRAELWRVVLLPDQGPTA
jgi:hypothetical protein